FGGVIALGTMVAWVIAFRRKENLLDRYSDELTEAAPEPLTSLAPWLREWPSLDASADDLRSTLSNTDPYSETKGHFGPPRTGADEIDDPVSGSAAQDKREAWGVWPEKADSARPMAPNLDRDDPVAVSTPIPTRRV
ncbi:MAG: hypothetical protein M3R06_03385, partial [Chloroflexota bacterium]|nr:hypothetical protein [Chloroflexota bacterium]